MITNRIVNAVNVSQRRHHQLVFVSAVCIGCGSWFICTSLGCDTAALLSVQSCKFDLLPCYTFISDKTIWSQTEAISVSPSLNILYACLRQCTALGQTALSYLESLYDKASMAPLHRLADILLSFRIKLIVFCVFRIPQIPSKD